MTALPHYVESLSKLQESQPLISEALVLAERRRSARLAALLTGARLSGLEQLYAYLYAAEKSYACTPAISGVSFLVGRVRADYQTAVEATLSGYQGVVADAMRDVMEIEALLLDFASSEDLGNDWLMADDETRRRKYAPVKVRIRLQDRGIPPFADDDFEPVDYKAHSEALHVNPTRPMGVTRGPEPSTGPQLPFVEDVGFIEMFEHGRRVMTAVELLRVVALGAPADYEPLTPRDAFDDAYARTHQTQLMMMSFVQGPAVLRERLGREPTQSELFGYVADEVEAKGMPYGPTREISDQSG